MAEDTRRLSALMITDMVGYTRLSQRDEALALHLLSEHDALIRDNVESHGGREIKHTGDGFLVEFPSALQAVSCSISIQRRFYDRNASVEEEKRFHVRIGLHVGDVVHRNGDVFGDGVNITSRIEPLALPDGVCISQAVQAQVWNKIDRPLRSLGPRELKNVQLPMEVFRIVLPWEEKAKETAAARILDRTRLAVLPLVNISQDPEDAYFTDGMTEELIYTLSRIPGIRVIAQTSVAAYKGTTKPVREIGRELSVGSLLEGSVRKSGDRLRVTVQLIDVATEENLWGSRFDRELADVFEIQTEISQEVASGLKRVLKAAVEVGEVKQPTGKLEAYTAYLKGRHFWTRRTKVGLLKAIKQFETAIAMDPGFAKAYSGLADTYSVLANHGHEDAKTAYPKARDAAKRALELDPDLAEAHASLGVTLLFHDLDIEAANEELERAIELNPSYATAQHWLGLSYQMQLQFDKALVHLQKALELDPMAHVIHLATGHVLQELGRIEEAKVRFKRAIELEPDYEGSPAALAEAESSLWNWCAAESILKKAVKRNPNNGEALSELATLQLVLGHRDAAEKTTHKARAVAPDARNVRSGWARYCYYTRRFDEALSAFVDLYNDHPDTPWFALMVSMIHLVKRNTDDARLWLNQASKARESKTHKYHLVFGFVRGILAAIEGDATEAERQIEIISSASARTEGGFLSAVIRFHMGEEDAAYRHLDQAVAQHDPWLIQLPLEPLLDPYRSDPRFARILEVMGLAKVAKTA